jgi:hypothetical protein
MADKKMDQFANQAVITVLESAANTFTSKKLETGISISEKVAWIINRIEYNLALFSAGQFNSDSDTCIYGLGVSASFPNGPALAETAILDYNSRTRLDLGVAATGQFAIQPIVKDFSSLPGGGILVPPVPIYLFCQSVGCVAAQTVVARMWYTLLQMSPDQYWELVEARRIISS